MGNTYFINKDTSVTQSTNALDEASHNSEAEDKVQNATARDTHETMGSQLAHNEPYSAVSNHNEESLLEAKLKVKREDLKQKLLANGLISLKESSSNSNDGEPIRIPISGLVSPNPQINSELHYRHNANNPVLLSQEWIVNEISSLIHQTVPEVETICNDEENTDDSMLRDKREVLRGKLSSGPTISLRINSEPVDERNSSNELPPVDYPLALSIAFPPDKTNPQTNKKDSSSIMSEESLRQKREDLKRKLMTGEPMGCAFNPSNNPSKEESSESLSICFPKAGLIGEPNPVVKKTYDAELTPNDVSDEPIAFKEILSEKGPITNEKREALKRKLLGK